MKSMMMGGMSLMLSMMMLMSKFGKGGGGGGGPWQGGGGGTIISFLIFLCFASNRLNLNTINLLMFALIYISWCSIIKS